LKISSLVDWRDIATVKSTFQKSSSKSSFIRIYSTAGADFAHSIDFVELEKKHKFMHQMVKQVVDLKRMHCSKGTAQELVKVRGFADIVVALITKVEERVNWSNPEP
jgi:hypothetical protein